MNVVVREVSIIFPSDIPFIILLIEPHSNVVCSTDTARRCNQSLLKHQFICLAQPDH